MPLSYRLYFIFYFLKQTESNIGKTGQNIFKAALMYGKWKLSLYRHFVCCLTVFQQHILKLMCFPGFFSMRQGVAQSVVCLFVLDQDKSSIQEVCQCLVV